MRQCLCLPGYFQVGIACVLCPCPNGTSVNPCPHNSYSLAGSVSSDNCTCRYGWLAELDLPVRQQLLQLLRWQVVQELRTVRELPGNNDDAVYWQHDDQQLRLRSRPDLQPDRSMRTMPAGDLQDQLQPVRLPALPALLHYALQRTVCTCPKGSELDIESCKLCPVGKYKNTTSFDSYYPCPLFFSTA